MEGRKAKAIHCQNHSTVIAKDMDKMPAYWKHIRHSERHVRQEYYLVVDLLISKYHLSYTQAMASIFEV